MLNLDPAKLLMIAVVAVIVLGPNKLPDFARQVGAAWRSFAAFRARIETEVRGSIPDLPSTADLANYARSPGALLDRLAAREPDATTPAATPSGLVSDLPAIGAPERPHWTSVSYDAHPDAAARGARTETGPTVVDAALN